MATPQQIAVTQLYTALFNRAPDAAGLAFWEQAMLNGASINTIAQSFFTSPEALAIYPSAAPTTQFVTRFYTTVFGREPDAEGLVFWSNALDAQGGAGNAAARATLVTQLVDVVSTPLTSKPAGISDAAYAQTVADRGRFINKTDVGVYFATELKSDDRALAAKVLAAVTHEPASVTEARGMAVGTPTTPVTPGGGGGGGGGVVTPPPGDPTLTRANTAAEITALLASYQGASAKVDASQMDAAQLLAVSGASFRIAQKGISNLHIGADEAAGLTSNAIQNLLFRADAARVTITPSFKSSVSFLRITADNIADGGIDGDLALSWSSEFTFFFGPKVSTTANISIDASFFSSEYLLVLVDNIAKIDVINNLAVRWGRFDTMTEEMSAVLLSKASNPTFHLFDLNDAQLHKIAARIIAGEPTALLGVLNLERPGFTFEEISALLSKDTSGGASVSAAGLDSSQLASLSEHVGKISYLHDVSLVLGDPLMTGEVSRNIISKVYTGTIDITDATPAEFSATLARLKDTGSLKLIGDLPLTSAISAPDIVSLLSRYTGTTATADATGMSNEQLNKLAGWVNQFKDNGISNVTLRIDGTAIYGPMEQLLPKTSDAKLIISSLDRFQLTALAKVIDHVAVDGITGTFTMVFGVDAAGLGAVLGKVAADADVTIDAANMQDEYFREIAQHIDKVDLITNVSITHRGSIWAIGDITMATLLSKATGAKFVATNASGADAAVLVANLPKIADAGITGTLALDPTQFARVKSDLDVKLGADALVRITGTTGNDVVDLRDLSHGTKLDLGAGADVIQAGRGGDIVSIASTAHSRGQGFDLTNTSAANIDQVLGLAAGDVLSFSTAFEAYSPGFLFSSNATATIQRATFQAADNQNVSIQDVLGFLNDKTGSDKPVASTESLASFYEVTIEGAKGLSGTLLVLNDQNSVLNINDLIIGISGTVTAESFSFASM